MEPILAIAPNKGFVFESSPIFLTILSVNPIALVIPSTIAEIGPSKTLSNMLNKLSPILDIFALIVALSSSFVACSIPSLVNNFWDINFRLSSSVKSL